MWLVGTVALAQDEVVWDFDTSVPAAGALAGELLFEVPAFPWDGLALGVAPTAVSSTDAFGWVCLALPSDGSVLLTHPRMTAWVSTDAPADAAMMLMVDDDAGRWVGDGGVVATAGTWTALELTGLDAACGQSVGVDLALSGAVAGLDGIGWIDEIGFAGEPCPEFVDADGDALCPLGYDLDGDGVCLADDELAPGAPVDCDDARFGPSCLTLSVDATADGVTVTVTGAPAGGAVELWGSGRAGQTCPARFGGACLELARPKPIVVLTADDDGVASGTVSVPHAPGRPIGVHAAVAGAGPADLSQVVTAGG
ncbi:MAG: hypothetical protein ABMA64_03635 [Myxococcota bacterium]